MLAHEEIVPDTHILIRGDYKNKGEKVEPGFLSALNPGPPIDEPKGYLFVPQRRKALAQWLTSPDQPLLARVMVNRIWQGHFGRGSSGHRMTSGDRVMRLLIPSCSTGWQSSLRTRMEYEADAPADHAVRYIPVVKRGRRG